ncbi:MAG: CinA family protein [Pseudomonadota bacterium]|nr:CinA family protein [Pseudomonadota bacterium]
MDSLIDTQCRRLARLLMRHQQRLVTAESCTGGMIAALCTDLAGSSQWFECGFVTYSNAAKARDLGVPEDTLDSHGAVSEETVKAMVAGAVRYGDVAVAVSGIAGPGGAVPGKPVGTVWIAWGNEHEQTAVCHQFEGDRAAVREQTCAHALQHLTDYLDK